MPQIIQWVVGGPKTKMINYSFVNKYDAADAELKKISLSYETSDFSDNETVLNALIGTLVKYSNYGKIEPYLAESFNVSSDGKIWKFKLRSNLFCQDGSPITAETYKENLLNIFSHILKSSKLMDFQFLVGMDQFKTDHHDLKGLTTNQNELIFTFEKKPDDLLEFLRMPYFGYWKNLNISSDNIIEFNSSGAYTIDPTSDLTNLKLIKKDKWFSNTPKTIEYLNFNHIRFDDIKNKKSDFYELPSTISDESLPTNYDSVLAVPIIVGSLVLTPKPNGVFHDYTIRQSIYNQLIIELQKSTNLKYDFLYPSARSNINRVSNQFLDSNFNYVKNKLSDRTVTLAFNTNSYSTEAKNSIIGIVEKTLEKFNAKLKYFFEEPTPLWNKRLMSNSEFDIRVAVVSNGARPKNSIIKMMFCSKLGISFPDPNGKICKLTEDFRDLQYEDYISKFNQALYDDSVVLPIKHFGRKWFVSNRIKLSSFPPSSISPLFEKIELE